MPTHQVLVQNQFGTAMLQTGQPNLLCLPSWKSLTSPPHHTLNTPPGLNHFSCYPVTLIPGHGTYTPPAGIRLRDEFSAGKSVPVTVNPVAKELCLPTEKIVGNKTYPIINPTMHLLCFTVSRTPHKTPVYDQNQFGSAKMAIRSTKWLCLPSTKQLVS
jgi:hypothetical protein